MDINETVFKYYEDVFKWSLVKTKNFHQAEDLTQEIMEKIVTVFSRDTIIKDIDHYLWKIAYYTWCKKVKNYKDDRSYVNVETDTLYNYPDNVDILKELEEEEIKTNLQDEVNKLPKTMQQCIHLYYYEDLSIKEISDKLMMKESLVKYYLYEARKKLRRELND